MRKDISLGSIIVLSVQCASCLTTCWYWLTSWYVRIMVQDEVWAAYIQSRGKRQRQGWGRTVKWMLEEDLCSTKQHTPVLELLLITQVSFTANCSFR